MNFADRVRQYQTFQSDQRRKKDGILSPVPDVESPELKKQKVPLFTQLLQGIQNKIKPAIQSAKQKVGIMPQSTPTPMPSSTPIPTPTISPDKQKLVDMYKKGFEHWGNPPAATLAGTMADETMKYPVLQKNPELLAILTLLESGGGKNKIPDRVNLGKKDAPRYVYPSQENKEFNWYGWGFDPQFQFNPKSPEEVIAKVAKGIATKPQYAPFRDSGKIEDLARVYTPYDPEANPHGGDIYVKNYNDILRWFQNQ